MAEPTGGPLAFAGAATRIRFSEPFYVGLGVCSHDDDATERARFSNVTLTATASTCPRLPRSPDPPVQHAGNPGDRLDRPPGRPRRRRVGSRPPTGPGTGRPDLQRRRQAVPDQGDRRRAEPIDTGSLTRCNNDHGISPDGTTLAISDGSQGDRKSRIYTVPIAGGTPTLVTPTGAVVLARLGARRQDPGLLRRARRGVRHLHDPRRGRRRDPADDDPGPRRRPRIQLPTVSPSTSTPTARA